MSSIHIFYLIYFIGFVLCVYGSVLEYMHEKSEYDLGEALRIIILSFVAWYIFLPWIVGDYVYQKIKGIK